jgi:formate-dependent nitrite reductase cytochrome c552 subunit
MVTNKKLYDYFQLWRASTHGQEDVNCVDCHGGNAKLTDKGSAHASMPGGGMGAVSFRNIPKTCGSCHSDLYNAYTKSKHFKHLVKKQEEDQGPNCVTCHGSLNAKALNVNTVRNTCIKCHNAKTNNHPDIPLKAEGLLNDLNTIRAYNRFNSIRGDAATVAEAKKNLDPRVRSLAQTWHSFDLAKIEGEMAAVLKMAKEKRDSLPKMGHAALVTTPP